MITRLRDSLNISRDKPRAPEGQRVYAIGDIHGRSDLLDQLHDFISADLRTGHGLDCTIIYLGDYIDRGPDSAGVLTRLAGPPIGGAKRIMLKGNHEDMLERFFAHPETGPMWRQLGGTETLLSYGVDVKGAMATGKMSALASQLAHRIPDSHIHLLSTLLPCTTSGDYFFCHAGARPCIALDKQNPADLMWIRDDFLKSNHVFEKVIVHGHSPVVNPEFNRGRINIDTGAYATHRLSCLVLQADEQRILQAEAHTR